MNLFKASYREDFGHEYYVQILNLSKHFPRPLKRRSLLQFSVSWNEYASFPYFQLNMGSNGLLGIVFWVYKFGFDADICARTWDWSYLENSDENFDSANGVA